MTNFSHRIVLLALSSGFWERGEAEEEEIELLGHGKSIDDSVSIVRFTQCGAHYRARELEIFFVEYILVSSVRS